MTVRAETRVGNTNGNSTIVLSRSAYSRHSKLMVRVVQTASFGLRAPQRLAWARARLDVAQGARPLRRRGCPGIPYERCHGIRSKPRDKPDRVNPDTVATAREATTRQLSCKQGPSPSAEQHGTAAAVEPARSTPDQPTAQTDWTAAICKWPVFETVRAICNRRPKLACSRAQAAGLVGAAGARAWPPIERVGHLLVAPRPGPGPRHQAWEGESAPSEGGLPPSHRVRKLPPEVSHPNPCCCCSAGARAPGVQPPAGSLVP